MLVPAFSPYRCSIESNDMTAVFHLVIMAYYAMKSNSLLNPFDQDHLATEGLLPLPITRGQKTGEEETEVVGVMQGLDRGCSASLMYWYLRRNSNT